MLRDIDPILGPELLHILRAMGHGDEIAIVDANYPAARDAQRLVRLDGLAATRVLSAVLSVMPLDTFVEAAAHTMEVVGDATAVPEVVEAFKTIIGEAAGADFAIGTIERFRFYDRVKSAFAVVATGERRLYGNIILTKGIIRPEELREAWR